MRLLPIRVFAGWRPFSKALEEKAVRMELIEWLDCSRSGLTSSYGRRLVSHQSQTACGGSLVRYP